jgi:hypothetical protein
MLAALGWLVLKSRRTSLQALFIWAKYPTSRGCSLSVALGGRQTNYVVLSAFADDCSLMWDARISPIMTFLPTCFFRMGRASFSNQSWKMQASNQPLLEVLYLVPFGPPRVQLSYRFRAFYTTYGGITTPLAEALSMADTTDLVVFMTRSAYLVPFLNMALQVPGSSRKFFLTERIVYF